MIKKDTLNHKSDRKEETKIMPLKKRMFRSNMMILFAALLSLLLIVVFALVIFEDSVERQLKGAGGEWLSEQADMAVRSGRLFGVLLPLLLLIGIGAIAVILLLSAFFTRKLTRLVMEPVEKLFSGANRIQGGNLEEEIDYQGEAEFEQVCQAFNRMQRTILEDKEQRDRNERARTDMVTGISHDLRTPLTAIQGYIKGVLDNVADTPEKKEAYLKTAYEATEEMNVLLQKLFDFSRMESGQMPFYMVRVSLAEFADAYAAQKEAGADPQKLRLSFCQEGGGLAETDMDVEQVRRILDNLLENSVKYGKTLPICVWIRVEETQDAVTLDWQDNGPGVPEAERERIFERFYRCDAARSGNGSGVGLYVVRYIMERHGGTAQALPSEGGLLIRLRFPKENSYGEDTDC